MPQKQKIGALNWTVSLIITVSFTALLAGGLSYLLRPELNYALGAAAMGFGVGTGSFIAHFGRWFTP